MRIISKHELHTLLCEQRAGTWLSFTAVTKPKMISPWDNLFIQVSVVLVHIKCHYEKMVNSRRTHEGKEPTFHAQHLPWGSWEGPDSPFIRSGNKIYLRVYPFKTKSIYLNAVTGEVVPYNKIKYLFRKRQHGNKQGLEHPVEVRTYNLDAIRRISIGKERRFRPGRYKIQLKKVLV